MTVVEFVEVLNVDGVVEVVGSFGRLWKSLEVVGSRCGRWSRGRSLKVVEG